MRPTAFSFLVKAPASKLQLTLSSEVKYLKGVGPALAQRLRGLGIEQVQDLLFHLPLRYEDRRHVVSLSQLTDGEDQLIRARVLRAEVRYAGRRSLRVWLEDGDDVLLLRFFHFNDAQRKSFETGRWVLAFGPARFSAQGWEMSHPQYRVAASADDLQPQAELTAIYPLTTGVTQNKVAQIMQQALQLAARDTNFALPLEGLEAPDTLIALNLIHRPQRDEDAALLMQGTHPAQRRLVSEELLAHQLGMRLLRRNVRQRCAPVIAGVAAARDELQRNLPFALTGAQQRVITDIAQDLRAPRPMMRLVQGDVGSGKTLVAAVAMLATARAGAQAALMVPTELLAEQHALNFQRWMAPLGIEALLLSGRLKKKQKSEVLARAASGAAPLLIGTHAMFQSDVQFERLSLVVVDEQHRFGVQQRMALRDKGAAGTTPHQLIMSATPIPRTLAQTLYADLDVSVIDELPPGRSPVTTVAMSNERRPDVLARIGEVCAQGRQAYWVCTLVEESENLEAEAAEATAETLRRELPQLRIGLVHGRLKAEDKEREMRAFKSGETQLLVATTVIEVGVDVPNASIMIIENSERFGLSQLHQLRGRVGRGAVESQCVLMYQSPLSNNARARLAVMRETNDGFRIAQQDLELRGPGELLGRRQTGLVGFKIADPVRDQSLVPRLQQLADEWWQCRADKAHALIRRWVGSVEKYGQV